MNKITYLDGARWHRALVAGASNVLSRQEYLNKINVFPVPDGDTGTNLLFTLKPITALDRKTIPVHLGESLKLISDIFLVPKTFVFTASHGKYSWIGTCL